MSAAIQIEMADILRRPSYPRRSEETLLRVLWDAGLARPGGSSFRTTGQLLLGIDSTTVVIPRYTSSLRMKYSEELLSDIIRILWPIDVFIYISRYLYWRLINFQDKIFRDGKHFWNDKFWNNYTAFIRILQI